MSQMGVVLGSQQCNENRRRELKKEDTESRGEKGERRKMKKGRGTTETEDRRRETGSGEGNQRVGR